MRKTVELEAVRAILGKEFAETVSDAVEEALIRCMREINKLPSASEWVDAEEHKPDPGEKVVVMDMDGDVDIDYIDPDENEWFYSWRGGITHWAPLPGEPGNGDGGRTESSAPTEGRERRLEEAQG